MMNKRSKKIVILVLVLLLFLAAFLLLRTIQKGQNETASPTDKADTEALATLFFASDYQAEQTSSSLKTDSETTGSNGDSNNNDSNNSPEANLSAILDAAIADGKSIDQLIMCGDYSNVEGLYDYQLSPDKTIKHIRSIVCAKCEGVQPEQTIFVQGNHDALGSEISSSGLHEYGNYLVYVLNTQNDLPWKEGTTAGSLAKVKASAEALEACFGELIEKGEKRPIIIAAHIPLNYSARTSSLHTTGDNMYASLMFDAINEAAKELNIIYLFGHNHSKGWDSYIGGACVYKAVGDELLLPVFDENSATTDSFVGKRLNFTYLNAGYIGYYMNCYGDSNSYPRADLSLTGTVCEIYEDRIVLNRYTSKGQHCIGASGGPNPYGDYIDLDLIPAKYYSKQTDGPIVIDMK